MSIWNLPALWEIHPALVHFPIALLLSGAVLDLYAWGRQRAQLAPIADGLLIAGLLTGVLAALSGFLAFYTLPATHTEEAHTLMYWHLWLQVAALGVFASVVLVRWRLRERDQRSATNLRSVPAPATGVLRITGLVAAGLLVVGSYLGGVLVYHGAAGIDPKVLSPELRAGHHHGTEEPGHPAGPHHGEHEHEHEDANHHHDPSR